MSHPNAALIGQDAKSRLQTPALLLDLDRLEANIALFAALAAAAHIALRPHTKGGKSAEVARRQLAAGAIGICCATLGEAEAMAAQGLGPILLTSTVTTPQAASRLMALAQIAPGLMIVADDPHTVRILSDAAQTAGITLPVLVEADVGQGRTGARSAAMVVTVAQTIAAAPALRFAGMQAYYGHLQHIPSLIDRRNDVAAQHKHILALIRQLTDAGLPPAIVTGGGTGTFAIDAASGVFTELQAGSYPFMDRQYADIEHACGLQQALFVAAHVISAPEPGLAITNAGLKSFATEGGPPLPDIAATYRFMGDEHGGLMFDGDGPAPGTLVLFQPPHCDPTINLYDVYHVFRGDTLVAIWPVDGRGK